MQKEEIRGYLNLEPKLFGYLLASLKDVVIEKEFVRLAHFNVTLSQRDETIKSKILELLEKAGTQPLNMEELCQIFEVDQKYLSDILKLMVKEGGLVRINNSLCITTSIYRKAMENLKDFFSEKSEMTVKEFKDTFPTTRKYAIHFLEYLDSQKITKRVGDIRKFVLDK